jgi:hypothetical protein
MNAKMPNHFFDIIVMDNTQGQRKESNVKLDPRDRQDVIHRLREYDNKFDAILNLIVDKNCLERHEKEHAQKLLKNLKETLAKDRNEARRNDLTQAEEYFFCPAILNTNIRVRWNSDPINSNWHSELYGARIDISHTLHQLEMPPTG